MPTTLAKPRGEVSLEQFDLNAGSLQHAVHRTFEELGELEGEWDAYVGKNDGDLYSSLDWCRIWWHHYGEGRELEIHVFQKEGQLVGLIPTFREKLRFGIVSLRLIRLLGCDHSTTTCGLVIAADQIRPVMAAISAWLSKDNDWDMVHWAPLAGYFRHRRAIDDELQQNSGGWIVQSHENGGAHIIWDLPETFETYLANLTKKERSNIKIARKKLAEKASILDCEKDPQGIDHWLNVFINQHQTQWQAEGKLGHFADWPKAESFHRALAKTLSTPGRLNLLRMDVADQPIGFQYNYRFGRRIHWLLGSRDVDSKWDAYSSGRVLHVETIERAISNDDQQIDGLRGLYDYKVRLGGKIMRLQSIALIRRNAATKVKLARLIARLLDLFYYRIWFSRIAPRLPLRRRGLWMFWIRTRI